jgi:predicted subunit of tRNA(5-methylaminomethyl-2-thiouridylate) methyltransferase
LRSRGENPLDYFPKHIQSRVIGLKKRWILWQAINH